MSENTRPVTVSLDPSTIQILCTISDRYGMTSPLRGPNISGAIRKMAELLQERGNVFVDPGVSSGGEGTA